MTRKQLRSEIGNPRTSFLRVAEQTPSNLDARRILICPRPRQCGQNFHHCSFGGMIQPRPPHRHFMRWPDRMPRGLPRVYAAACRSRQRDNHAHTFLTRRPRHSQSRNRPPRLHPGRRKIQPRMSQGKPEHRTSFGPKPPSSIVRDLQAAHGPPLGSLLRSREHRGLRPAGANVGALKVRELLGEGCQAVGLLGH